jgi:hypothetical protein
MASRPWPGRGGTRPTGDSGDDSAAASTPDRRGDDLSGLADRNDAATDYLADGRPHDAVTALEPLLADCRRLLGAEHPDTLVVEGNLAVAHVLTGDEETGTQLMLANLLGRERVFGGEHVATLTARDAVAATHRLAGRVSDALWRYSQVAQQRNRVLGPTHPDTLTTRMGLGLTFAAAGDTAMALDVVTAALQDCDRAGAGSAHAEVLRSCLADLQRAGTTAPGARVPAVPAQRGAPAPAGRVLRRGRRPAIHVGGGSMN